MLNHLKYFKDDKLILKTDQVVNEPREKVSGGVKSSDDEGDDVAEDLFVVEGIVQDRVQKRRTLVISGLPAILIKLKLMFNQDLIK